MLTDQFTEAVTLYRQALSQDDLIPLREAILLLENTTPADLPLHRGLLVEAYLLFLAMTNDLRAADEVIDLCRATLGTLGPRHPDRGWFLTELAAAHFARLRAGSIGDLRDVIEIGEHALQAPRPKSRSPLFRLQRYDVPLMAELGEAYEQRFRWAKSPKDLDRAIVLRRTALAGGRANDPLLLAGLCRTYLTRFDQAGARKDFRRAAETAKLMVVLVGAEAAGPYTSLVAISPSGKSLESVWRGLPEDQRDAAIGFGELVISLSGLAVQIDETPAVPDHPITVPLAGVYLGRFLESGLKQDIERAAALVQRGDWQSSMPLAGRIHLARAAASGSTEDLQIAIALFEETLQFDATSMANLADAYRAAFVFSRDAEFLRRATDLSSCALSLAPIDRHVVLVRAAICQAAGEWDDAIMLYAKASAREELASVYLARYLEHGGEADLRQAISHSSEGSATRCWAYRWLWSITPADVPPVETLSAVGILANRALGALASLTGRPDIAVARLDQAVALLRAAAWRDVDWQDQEIQRSGHRGLTAEAIAAHLVVGDPVGAVRIAEQGRAITFGSELDIRVPSDDPRLAEVRSRLTSPMVADLVGEFHDNVGRSNRAHLWASHDALSDAPAVDVAVDNGAVVLVNHTNARSDAIIIDSSGPSVIPLPELRLTSAPAPQQALDWLWDTVVGPVIDELTVDRVWWLPIGRMGAFPLHAAQAPGQPGALDLITSSYLPTLGALHHIRQRPPADVRRQLTVAMHHTPGLPDLPGTAAEATAMQADQLLTDATVSEVLAALSECTWAHFACHASANPDASSRAVLHLRDTALPVEVIGRLGLAQAELAYLSACSTADRSLYSDEPTNLAAAFQLAGFRHVIASLWPLNDKIAARAAASFYRQLPSADQAAQTVRAVSLELREAYPTRSDLWASLIHSGP